MKRKNKDALEVFLKACAIRDKNDDGNRKDDFFEFIKVIVTILLVMAGLYYGSIFFFASTPLNDVIQEDQRSNFSRKPQPTAALHGAGLPAAFSGERYTVTSPYDDGADHGRSGRYCPYYGSYPQRGDFFGPKSYPQVIHRPGAN